MRITLFLIILNALVFFLQLAMAPFTDVFALTPELFYSGAYWQIITYMFLHGGLMHIFINMFMLFIFGESVEQALGKTRYLVLYIGSGIGSAIAYMILTGFTDLPFLGTQLLGASGAVFGVMAGYSMMFPDNRIMLGPRLSLPPFVLVLMIAALEFIIGFYGLEEGIANFGHFGGIITGLIITYLMKKYYKPKSLEERRNADFFWS